MRNKASPAVGIFTEGTATGSFLPTLRGIFGPRAVFEIGARELRDPVVLAGFDLLVLPGVSSETSHYPQVMDAPARAAIMGALRDGTDIWTSCAASYFFTKSYSYASPAKTVTGRTGLGVFRGSAWGPVDGSPPNAPEKTRFSDTRIVMVSFNDAANRAVEAGICYSNGPAYIPARGEKIDIIARYRDVPGMPISTAAKTVGKGVVVFSGALPEMAPAEMSFAPGDGKRYPHLARLHRESARHEAGRKSLLDVIVNKFRAGP